MNDNAMRAAEVLETNVTDLKSYISLDNDVATLQTLKRMVSTIKVLKKSVKDNSKLKKNLNKNAEKTTSTLNTSTTPTD